MFNLIPRKRSDYNTPALSGNRGFDLFERFFEEFGLSGAAWDNEFFNPKVNISEKDDKLIVKAEVPGMDKDKIDVNLSNGILTISGEKKNKREEKNERRHLVEISSGSFRRSFHVGEDIEAKDIDASYKDGVLEVVLPKSEKSVARKIEVKS